LVVSKTVDIHRMYAFLALLCIEPASLVDMWLYLSVVRTRGAPITAAAAVFHVMKQLILDLGNALHTCIFTASAVLLMMRRACERTSFLQPLQQLSMMHMHHHAHVLTTNITREHTLGPIIPRTNAL
jgi:hypothetical protein